MIRARSRSTVWMGGAEIPKVKSTVRIGRAINGPRQGRLGLVHPAARFIVIIPSTPLNCSKRTKNRPRQPIRGHWNGLTIDSNTPGRPQRIDERIEGKGPNHQPIPLQLHYGTSSTIHQRAQSPPYSNDGTTITRLTKASCRCAAPTPRRRRITIPQTTARRNHPSVPSPVSLSAASSPPSASTSPSLSIVSAKSRTLWGWIRKCPIIH